MERGRSVLSRGVSHLRRNTVAYLALIDRAQPAVRVEDDTQVELTSATAVLMDLDDEIFDTGEMHPGNGNDDRIRVPRTGTYVLSGEVEWAPNGSGYRTLDLVQLNAGVAALGSSLVEPRDSAIQPTIQQVTAIVRET